MILVTGSAGYLGSHICKKLLEKKISFYSIDNLSCGRIENVFKKSFFKKIDYSSIQVKKFLVKKKLQQLFIQEHLPFQMKVKKIKKSII